MQSINAQSLTHNVLNWLANSRHPRILHVFDHACNLINERREVLSIVTPQIGNGPFNVVIDGNDFAFSNYVYVDSQIIVSHEQIALGNIMISVQDAALWSPYPDWATLHANRKNIFNQLASLLITNYQPLLPNSLISNLSSALAIADISSALTITSQLAGLGIGLTPAGDDFLLGAIYAAWIIHPLQTGRVLAEEMANTAVPLTTSLSAAWLRSAGKGEAGILWHNFWDALISANELAVQEPVEKLLSVGHTSGADALAGFIGSLMCWAARLNP